MRYVMRMKARKNLYLSVEAVARGERLARAGQTSLSDLVEKQLLQIPEMPGSKEDFWNGPAAVFPTGVPDGLSLDRLIDPAMLNAGEEPSRRRPLRRAVVDAELVEQFRTERHVAVVAAFA